jgi:hypothetical protein
MLRVFGWSGVLVVVLSVAGCSSSDDDDDQGPSSSAGGGICAKLVDKLKSCDVADEASGTATCVDELISECVVDCLLESSCDDVGIFFCTPDTPAAFDSCRQTCTEPEFDCGDGSGSYPASFVCDGIADCGNGVDEADCGFTCNDQSTIDGSWQCDGIPDCLEAEDEADCLVLECTAYLDPPIPADHHAGCEPFSAALADCGLLGEGPVFCSPAMTPCLADCYASQSCAELTDTGCTGMPTQVLMDCAAACPQTYSCDGVSGLAPDFVCDGVPHCDDGSDEPADCPTFACGSGEVVPLQWLCDGTFIDCEDESDEADCATLLCPEP